MPAKGEISTADWQRKLDEVQVSKQDLNRLLMDYLVVEGYKTAAQNFSRESGLESVDLDSMEHRMCIRNAIQAGDIEAAVERINDVNPEILDANPELYFHLQQQRLIELIRQGRIADALVFAQQELAPRGEEHPAFLAELERTMALLAFDIPAEARGTRVVTATPSENALPPNLASLLQPSQRRRTALEVNAALLVSQSHSPSSKLPALLRMLAWGEHMLGERVTFPGLDLPAMLAEPTSATAGDDESMTL